MGVLGHSLGIFGELGLLLGALRAHFGSSGAALAARREHEQMSFSGHLIIAMPNHAIAIDASLGAGGLPLAACASVHHEGSAYPWRLSFASNVRAAPEYECQLRWRALLGAPCVRECVRACVRA